MNKILLTLVLCCTTPSASAQKADLTAWRSVFTDPHLGVLIETAMEHNADLLNANLNVEQADAGLRMARLSILPSLTVGADGSLSKTNGAATTKTYSVPLTLQWEADLSGRLRGEKQAALANYWSTAETERAVRLRLIASVATHYYTLVMMDEQLNVTRQSMDNALQTVEVIEALKEVGMQNEAAVSQARTAYLNIAASEKTLLQQIKTTENALIVLIGEKCDSIGRTTWNNTDICIADTMPYSIETLANRPDVKAAEYVLKAKMAQVNVARAAFYPQLTISASAGWTNNVGEIVNPGQILLNAIGSLVQPLFNKGQNRANLRIAKAQQEQAMVAFNQSLLVAGGELSDALSACRLSRERLALRQQEVAAAERAYEVSKDLMQNSSSTYLEVLTAQQSLLQSRLSLATDRFDLIQGKINLFKALGGKIENKTRYEER
ncbi:MAG: efflux transporter outer membrane subunit [Prevotella sp.]|nr:efflux transporter outer membrane subunit [Prevotella sp.]